MDQTDETDSGFLNGFHLIQTVLARYRNLTGSCVTIDPDFIYISDSGSPVSSILKIADTLEKQEKKIKEVRTYVKRLEHKIDRTREQLELQDTPWIEIRNVKDLMEELLHAVNAKQEKLSEETSTPLQPEPMKTTPPPYIASQTPKHLLKKTFKYCCHRCRRGNHKTKDCQAGPPLKPCPRCNGKHWMYDCPTQF